MKLLRWNSVRPQRPQGNKTEPRASHRADRGWKSRKVSPLPVEGEIFFLTFPFIEQAFTQTTCLALRRRSAPIGHWCNGDVTTATRWDSLRTADHTYRIIGSGAPDEREIQLPPLIRD